MESGEIREEALYWWRESLHNLRQAKKNFEIEEYSVAAFLCHQVAEKALKALYIVRKNRLPPRLMRYWMSLRYLIHIIRLLGILMLRILFLVKHIVERLLRDVLGRLIMLSAGLGGLVVFLD
jgi:HEPN domain-containing protein